MLHRRLKVCSARVARIIDRFRGRVRPPRESKPMDVTVGLDYLDRITRR
jgi:hypothetical protein